MAPLQHHQTTSHQTYLLAQKKPLKGSPRPSRERAPWTPEEDNLLKLAVQLYGDKTEKWAKIAACVPGRTNKNCRKRWFHSLDPSLRKGAWTEEEDQLLREGVSKYPNQWSKIADMLPGRTDDQCAKRWRESLDPSIDRSEWTPAEDTLLMAKYEEYGSQWQKIAFFFDGRPGLHCRNRWRKLQRMVQVKKDKEGNVNASFFNTMAGEQPLRFQHANPTSLASSSKTIP
ncbi:Homeodomain-like DNA binding domain-containing transcription factor, partial [Mucor lusitanicus CBS 277.49]